MDTRLRSFVKSLIWTLVGLVMMSLIGLIFTGSMALGGVMALINAVMGFVCYAIYERIWDRIGWGRSND